MFLSLEVFAAPVISQSGVGGGTGDATVTLTAAAAGDTIVVVATGLYRGALGVSDTQANSYALVAETGTSAWTISIWTARVVANGTSPLDVTCESQADTTGCLVLVVSGLAPGANVGTPTGGTILSDLPDQFVVVARPSNSMGLGPLWSLWSPNGPFVITATAPSTPGPLSVPGGATLAVIFGGTVAPDGGSAPDAGTPLDAGGPGGNSLITPDAGGAVDGGSRADAGETVGDAGGPPDAGSAVDAGALADAGPAVDAGSGADAGGTTVSGLATVGDGGASGGSEGGPAPNERGAVDAGVFRERSSFSVGAGCQAAPGLWFLITLVVLRRRPRPDARR
jgi:hypothetical protein